MGQDQGSERDRARKVSQTQLSASITEADKVQVIISGTAGIFRPQKTLLDRRKQP